MKNAIFVNASELKTIEQYGASLLSSIISLKTLEQFHVHAFAKGLLDDDELECGKTIIWEIRRLIGLYKNQIDNIVQRAPLDEQKLMCDLKNMMQPSIKIATKKPTKRRTKDD